MTDLLFPSLIEPNVMGVLEFTKCAGSFRRWRRQGMVSIADESAFADFDELERRVRLLKQSVESGNQCLFKPSDWQELTELSARVQHRFGNHPLCLDLYGDLFSVMAEVSSLAHRGMLTNCERYVDAYFPPIEFEYVANAFNRARMYYLSCVSEIIRYREDEDESKYILCIMLDELVGKLVRVTAHYNMERIATEMDKRSDTEFIEAVKPMLVVPYMRVYPELKELVVRDELLEGILEVVDFMMGVEFNTVESAGACYTSFAMLAVVMSEFDVARDAIEIAAERSSPVTTTLRDLCTLTEREDPDYFDYA